MVDLNALKGVIVAAGENQSILADAMGMTIARLNARFTGRVEFSAPEMEFIKNRYQLSNETFMKIFFCSKEI